jgi:membrane-bound ClpP family serine protease
VAGVVGVAGVAGVVVVVGAVVVAEVSGAPGRFTTKNMIAIMTITAMMPMITFRLFMIFPQAILTQHSKHQASTGCKSLYGAADRWCRI